MSSTSTTVYWYILRGNNLRGLHSYCTIYSNHLLYTPLSYYLYYYYLLISWHHSHVLFVLLWVVRGKGKAASRWVTSTTSTNFCVRKDVGPKILLAFFVSRIDVDSRSVDNIRLLGGRALLSVRKADVRNVFCHSPSGETENRARFSVLVSW